jgi:hypothetical protein
MVRATRYASGQTVSISRSRAPLSTLADSTRRASIDRAMTYSFVRCFFELSELVVRLSVTAIAVGVSCLFLAAQALRCESTLSGRVGDATQYTLL